MRVLFLTQVLPFPLDAGPKVRNYYVLRRLAEEHEITLVSFIRGEHEKQYAEHLSTFCHAVHMVPIRRARVRDALYLASSLASRDPFLIARDHIPAMDRVIRELISREHFDVVHADQLAMAQYAFKVTKAKKVLDDHNAMWTLVRRLWKQERSRARRLVLGLEWRKMKGYEADVCERMDHVFCVSDTDRDALLEAIAENRLVTSHGAADRALSTDEKTVPNSQFRILNSEFPAPRFATYSDSRPSITTIPICIDAGTTSTVERTPGARNAVCVGGMFYPPNVDGVLWFTREVMPYIRGEFPDTRFYAVGARPVPAILTLAERDPALLVTGYVPDITPFLKESAVFVVPIRSGGGMRVKILEAWARGLPVVSTTVGCEGIEVQPGENILIADSPEEFAQATTRIICEPEVGQRLGEAGRRWVQERYDWRTRYAGFNTIYSTLLSPH